MSREGVGRCVLLDGGAAVDVYALPWQVGMDADERFEWMHSAVLEAQTAAILECVPGKTHADVDAAARHRTSVITTSSSPLVCSGVRSM